MTLVLVDRDALAEVIDQAWGNERCYANRLMHDDPITVLAVEAGLELPGAMSEGEVPPVPPRHRFANGADHLVCAATYRTKKDPRLRCEADAKVVYTTLEQAAASARTISQRQPMKAYAGQCGHYHVARIKP